MILFDIGANKGDATQAGLAQGYNVVAVEPAPRVFLQLVKTFIYDKRVTPLKMAVAETDYQNVEFFEAEEDGLSTLNIDWLTSSELPYAGKPFRTIQAITITLDKLAELYGEPDLTKIDVEGAEWSVFKGMTKYHNVLTFEWTDKTLPQHVKQLKYLAELGYKEMAPQFIENHLTEPKTWLPIAKATQLPKIIEKMAPEWENEGWKTAGLRPTADVGMLWVR